MKNKVILVICILIMLVPAVLAIVLYKQKPPEIIADPEGVSLVTITDSLSNVYTVEDKDEIKFLTELASGTPVSSVPDAVYNFKTFVFKFTRGDSTVSYRFYMSAEMPEQVYYKDGDEKCYKADSLKSRAFMEKQYAISLYDTAVPVLTVGDNASVIQPYEIAWNYSTVDGNYIPISAATANEVKNIDKLSKQTLGISFSRKPSNAVITVFDGSEQLYSKLLEDFTGITTREAKYYTVQIHATWNEEAGQNSYGSATYKFNAYVMPDAEFSFSATDIQQGGVIAITVKNASAAGLSVECTPDIKAIPKFYDDGQNTFAYLPTSYETEPGEYTLKMTYDGNEYEQTITVREVKYNSKTYTNSESVIKSVFSAENAAAEETMKLGVFSQTSPSGLLCEGEKIKTPTDRTTHKTGYGLYVTFESTGGKARHDGIDYDVSKGTSVKAVLSGTVVYVGTSPIHGGTVVIDHGNGVRTWYCRVDTSLASVGQTVKQGDVIAKSNDSGFGDSSRVHFGVSVGETFVSPLWILDNGLPK